MIDPPPDCSDLLERAKEHFLCGVSHIQQESWSEAEKHLRDSLSCMPDRLSTLINLSGVLIKLNRLDEAVDLLNRAESLDSRSSELALNRGLLFHQSGRYHDAVVSYEKAIVNRPNYPEALGNLAVTLNELNRHEFALECCERALELRPEYAEAWSNRGVTLRALRRYQEALDSHERAIELKPEYAEAWSNRGVTLRDLRRYQEALDSYEKAIELKPEYAEAWSNRGVTLRDLRRYQEALDSHEKAIELKPEYAEAWSDKGVALNDLGRHTEALSSFERSLELKPNCAEAWCNRGVALSEIGQYEDAEDSYDTAVKLNPEYADAYWNKSLELLRNGLFIQGWKLYEWRWKCSSFKSTPRRFSQPLWLGEQSLNGATILLHSEQGYGDSIQFCRYAPMITGLGARVVIEVERPLVELLSTLEGVDSVIEKGEHLPDFDFQCPLMSLPCAFKTELASIPREIPYLHVSHKKRERWGHLLRSKGHQPRVGVTWSGNPGHYNDCNRSIGLAVLTQILMPSVQWICLQKELTLEDHRMLHQAGVEAYPEQLEDFGDTAALISHLDLVISVDTSVAHLAGALGKPVWVLLPHVPDYRWMRSSHDTPWYPSMRLFRQASAGDWDGVLSEVRKELSSY